MNDDAGVPIGTLRRSEKVAAERRRIRQEEGYLTVSDTLSAANPDMSTATVSMPHGKPAHRASKLYVLTISKPNRKTMPTKTGVCKRCGNAPANLYRKGLPKETVLCEPCWRKFIWARAERSALWEASNEEFLQGFLKQTIPVYPDDAEFKHRVAIRGLFRMYKRKVRKRAADERSFQARQEDIALAAEFLEEPLEKIEKMILVADIAPGITALENRMKALIRDDSIYQKYLRNINDLDKKGTRGPGVVSYAGLLGEIGSARTLLCFRHERGGYSRPKPLHKCEHGRDENWDEALLVSRPNQRAYGIHAFPDTGCLRSFFGLGFRATGGHIITGDHIKPWFLRSKVGEDGWIRHSSLRKVLVTNDLAVMGIEKSKGTPWNDYLNAEKVKKLEAWRSQFADHPPEKCTACINGKCKKCENYGGNWERPKNKNQAIWVCRCHEAGYWFGSPSHIRFHALGKTGSLFLDLLFHTWKWLEGFGEEPRHPLARRFLNL